ncbi:hypothetical protein [Providencia sp. PROV269]|uniref:hypothetical protein n=1 Tax=Providencia sp. PROV269 TaxID=2949957 RepID=UPI00234B9051|nr:hypothetical protein [Providencia sp. PROV269]
MYKASIIIASLLFSTLASATSLESQLSSKNIMTFSAEYSLHNGGNGGHGGNGGNGGNGGHGH